jgi:hypothetical protein
MSRLKISQHIHVERMHHVRNVHQARSLEPKVAEKLESVARNVDAALQNPWVTQQLRWREQIRTTIEDIDC